MDLDNLTFDPEEDDELMDALRALPPRTILRGTHYVGELRVWRDDNDTGDISIGAPENTRLRGNTLVLLVPTEAIEVMSCRDDDGNPLTSFSYEGRQYNVFF